MAFSTKRREWMAFLCVVFFQTCLSLHAVSMRDIEQAISPQPQGLKTWIQNHQQTFDSFLDTFSLTDKRDNFIALNAAFQSDIVNRKPGQERWETETSEDFEKKAIACQSLLDAWGSAKEMLPAQKKLGIVAILGASFSRMEERLTWTLNFLQCGYRIDHLYFLVGERYVTVGVDGTQEQLEKIAQQYNKAVSSLTETDLARFLASQASELKNQNVSMTFIDTPRGQLTRPNTQTTVQDFLNIYQQKHPNTVVTFVSNGEHKKVQEAVIEAIAYGENLQNFSFTVIGPAYKGKTMAPVLRAFASWFWARLPLEYAKNPWLLSDEDRKQIDQNYQHSPLMHRLFKLKEGMSLAIKN